jgi:bifunctional UDP-N-acetylglucosamine pyrophosphorylase/glucosamine-1-phosphate N-acetyltransferase
MNSNRQKIDQLMQKGVVIPNPESVEIGEEIKVENISNDRVIIHSGCRLFGKSTFIMGQTQIGYESPATIQDCQLGPHVTLKGGFFKESVFLEKSSAGSGSHVREGCIFEEEANIAHTVGLKQTILFPFVTLGSLINFCDCLMAGGTSRKDHSEVGSAYIHFNFTPNQDKATPSLLGDVPKGVMLDQLPIFLGGQGGLVGPSRLAFGTVIVAGTLFRKDATRPGRMLFEGAGKGGNVPFVPGLYRGIKRIVVNNSLYIGNLVSLLHWYQHVRSLFISDNFPHTLQAAVMGKLQLIIQEHIQRLNHLIDKMPLSMQKYKDIYHMDTGAKIMVQQKELFANQSAVNDCLLSMQAYPGDTTLRDQFLNQVAHASQNNDKNYIKTVQSLDSESKQMGSNWLQGIVDKTLSKVLEILPSFHVV